MRWLAPAGVKYIPRPGPLNFVQAHVWLMMTAFGVVYPAGVFVATMAKGRWAKWYWGHVGIQTLGTAMTVAGFGIGVYKFEVLLMPTLHAKMGLVLLALLSGHVLLAALRPSPDSKLRIVWYTAHQGVGMATLVGGCAANYTGFLAYKKKHGPGLQWCVVPYLSWSLFCLLVYILLARRARFVKD